MRLMIPLFPYREPELIREIGGVTDLIKSKGYTNVMIVTDRGIRTLGLTEPLERLIESSGLSLTV